MDMKKIKRLKNYSKYVLISGIVLFIIGIFLSTRESCREIVEDGKTKYVLSAPFIIIGILILISSLIVIFIGLIAYLHYNKKYKITLKREIDDFNRR